MKTVKYNGATKSYSNPKVPKVDTKPGKPKKGLKDDFGGCF